MIGPNTIDSQCLSKSSRRSVSRLSGSVGNGKTPTICPSGSVTRSGGVGSGKSGVLSSAALPAGLECEFDPAEGAQSRAQEAGRLLISAVEQIVDPGEGGDPIAEIVRAGEVDDGVCVGLQPRYREVPVAIGPRPHVKQRCG